MDHSSEIVITVNGNKISFSSKGFNVFLNKDIAKLIISEEIERVREQLKGTLTAEERDILSSSLTRLLGELKGNGRWWK